MSQETERYANLLERFVLGNDTDNAEQNLAEAFELGRQFVEKSVPPDELMNIHHNALVQLAHSQPDIAFADVADRITAPLLEMSMAYGLTFRQQSEERFNTMVRERYEQTSRLQAVGTLAAGIAHDFNNIIGGIWGYSELLHDDAKDQSAEQFKLEQIMKGCGRARDLVNRMLTFARQQSSTQHTLNLSEQVREALDLLTPSLKNNVSLSLTETLDNPTVHAAPGVLQQVIMNLCLNANDAIDHTGTIRVHIGAGEARRPTPPGHEHSVCIRVADTGSGMPPEIVEQVFNPFFTTKEPGHGSGLGLSVVHGIVTQLGGVIEIHSECSGSNTGTEFTLFIPAATPTQPLPHERKTHYGQCSTD